MRHQLARVFVDYGRALFHCALWYTGSMLSSIFGKSAMKIFPHPITVTIAQLIVINLCLPFFLKGKMPKFTRKDWTSWVIPLTVLKLIVSLSSQLSILKVPISYAHTVKGMMPIFTVLLSKLFLKQHHSMLAYISLLPIISGVIIASVTEIEFNMLGLISALISTFTFAIQNIYSKKVMKGGLNHIAILIIVSRASLLALLPYWLYAEGFSILFGTAFSDLGDQAAWVAYQLVLGGICNSMQTIFAFTFLSYVTPVTYSVANVAKRVLIIAASMMFFNNPVTPANLAGITIAILGIALYNKAKLDERQRQSLQTQLSKPNSAAGINGKRYAPLLV
eukprot:m.158394 g.158394  ORF g.158394 m.158394 type:complete len:335 (-) comp16332_c0_seq1:247-1251(-)